MTEIKHRVFASMTRGADMRGVLVKSASLAVFSTLFTVPYFHYLIFTLPVKSDLAINLGLRGLLFIELFFLFIICFLSSIVGFSFSNRLELPGFGDKTGFVHSIPLLLALGAVMTVLSYFLFDRYFFKISPASYPKDVLYLLMYPFKAAFAEEVILRFCLVTLGVGIFRSKVAGVVLVSVLASIFTIKYFHFLGMGFRLNYLFITHLLLSFLANLFLGYLFVTRGLLYAMALNFLFGMKYAVLSWVID